MQHFLSKGNADCVGASKKFPLTLMHVVRSINIVLKPFCPVAAISTFQQEAISKEIIRLSQVELGDLTIIRLQPFGSLIS